MVARTGSNSLRYDQRDRIVRERTRHICRLRNAALRLDIKGLPSDLTSVKALAEVRVAAEGLRGRDVAVDALIDDVLFAIDDIARATDRVRGIEAALRPLLRRIAPELLAMHGVSTVIAAGLVGHAGNLQNTRDAAAFAMRCGVAPVSWSSGRSSTVRINTGGNRQLNRLLHVIALSQIRSTDHAGRAYYDRKRREGKTHRGAMRSLKRQLCTVVYYRLRSCPVAPGREQEAIQAA
jgi:transposase